MVDESVDVLERIDECLEASPVDIFLDFDCMHPNFVALSHVELLQVFLEVLDS